MFRALLFAAPILLLAACDSGPSPDSMSVSRDGSQVTGQAGSNWSDEELRSNAYAAVCSQNERVSNLQISRDANGVATFSATCVG